MDTEQEFLALRRLVASRAGFAAFTQLAGFREKLGLKVVKALQRNRDHVTQAAVDVLCALMEPMYDESDLRQEQLNKSSLLSSSKFLEGTIPLPLLPFIFKLTFSSIEVVSSKSPYVVLEVGLGPDWDLNSYKQIDPKNKAICLNF